MAHQRERLLFMRSPARLLITAVEYGICIIHRTRYFIKETVLFSVSSPLNVFDIFAFPMPDNNRNIPNAAEDSRYRGEKQSELDLMEESGYSTAVGIIHVIELVWDKKIRQEFGLSMTTLALHRIGLPRKEESQLSQTP
jgi:hypothetical protein